MVASMPSFKTWMGGEVKEARLLEAGWQVDRALKVTNPELDSTPKVGATMLQLRVAATSAAHSNSGLVAVRALALTWSLTGPVNNRRCAPPAHPEFETLRGGRSAV